jgi:cell fate (sporulation/competence/biofilm development) regulator YmcA (YheA/YmcA/DUF963 family)
MENRRDTNKIKKIEREIKRLQRIKKRDPNSQVDNTIDELREAIEKWKTRQ